MDVGVGWVNCLGLAGAFHRFDDPDALTGAFVQQLRRVPRPTYLCIDKDTFSVDIARTSWDHGHVEEHRVLAIIEALRGTSCQQYQR